MEKSKNKLALVLIIIAVFMINMSCMNEAVMTPSLSAVYEELQTDSIMLKAYITSGLNYVALPFLLLLGKITEKISKKHLIIVCLAVMGLTSISFSVFVHSMVQFAIVRSVQAIASNLVYVLAMAIVFDVISDEKRQATVLGWSQAVYSGWSSMISVIAGYVCVVSWRYAQLLGAFAFLAMVMVIAVIPYIPPTGSKDATGIDEASEENQPAKKGNMKAVIYTLVECILLGMVTWAYYYYCDLYVSDRNIGDSSLSGILFAILMIACAIPNLFFGVIYEKLKKYTTTVGAALIAVTYFVLSLDVSLPIVYIMTFLNGFGLGVYTCYHVMLINEYAPEGKTDTWLGIVNAMGPCSWYVSGMLPFWLMDILGTDSYQATLKPAAVIVVCIVVVVAIFSTWLTRYDKQVAAEAARNEEV